MVVGWGLQSHFCVQPNNCVEVVFRCVVVRVVTKVLIFLTQEKSQGFVFLDRFIEIHTKSREHFWSTNENFWGNIKPNKLKR